MDSFLNEFVAGWFGGCAGVIVSQPMDTLKVRMQAVGMHSVAEKHHPNSWNVFHSIVKYERIFGLYKGMAPPLAAVAFQNALLFCSYGNTLRLFNKRDDGRYAIRHVAFAGAVSGLVQLAVICPTDLVKIKLQMQTEARITSQSLYQGPLDCLRKLHAEQGLKGWFQGVCVTFFRDVPGFAVYFGAIEMISDWLTSPGQSPSQLGTLKLMMAGGLGGMISWFSTFPLDVVKSRLQADGNRGRFIYKGAVNCAVKSYRSEGLLVFYKGLGPTLLRAFPCNAAIYSVYALVHRVMSNTAIFRRETVS